MPNMQQPTEAKPGHEMPYLPAEIIFDICGYLTVDSHNPAKECRVSLSNKDNIYTLRQLSLTCRAIHVVVTPSLYGYVYFTGPVADPDLPMPTDRQNPGAESLVYFLRTMVQNAELRQHVKGVACLIDLRDRCNFEEEMDTINKDYGILSMIRECKEIRTKRFLHRVDSWIERSLGPGLGFEAAFGITSRRPIISMGHQLFASIVCLLPNLTSISLKSGSHYPCYPRSPEMYDFNDIGISGRVAHTITQHIPLENLRALQVQCEPDGTIFPIRNQTINLRDMVPVLRNAPNLTLVRSYGCDSTWSGLPATVASFEGWGPVSSIPLEYRHNSPMMHLRTVLVNLKCASKALEFNLCKFCVWLGFTAPALERLEVLLSPRTCTKPTDEFIPLVLNRFSQLQYLCFDSRFFSDDHWNDPAWQDPALSSTILPSSIETLRIVDSEPRCNPDIIVNWLQLATRLWSGVEHVSRLEMAEYLHMPPLTDTNLDEHGCNFSKLENEAKQELALRGVQFQLLLVNTEGGKLSASAFMKQDHIPTGA